MNRFWDWLTWDVLYFVRRGVCRVRGHDFQQDTSAPPFEYFCTRCAMVAE